MTDLMTRPPLDTQEARDQRPKQRLGSAGEIKPKLRGWIHAATVPLIGIGTVILIILARGSGAKLSLAVYLVCALFLFANSAAYHIGDWTESVRATLRRIDHSNIYLFVAGTYTPLSFLLLDGTSRVVILALIWGIAVLGIFFSVFWVTAPRWLTSSLYVLMGWVALWWLPQFARSAGVTIVLLVVLGGVLYSIGAFVYALKRPNFSPTWYGFHELFHTFTVLAAVSHFIAISMAVATSL